MRERHRLPSTRLAVEPRHPTEPQVVERRLVQGADGVRLHVAVHGDGPACVVVPSTGNAEDFEALRGPHRVVFFDIRNRGRSDAVDATGRVGLPVEVDDVDAVRAALGAPSCSLVAWSYPALIAALYAARHPLRVDRLVLVCPPPARDVAHVPPSRAPSVPPSASADAARAARRATARASMVRPEAAEALRSDPGRLPNEWPEHVADALARVAASFPAAYDLLPELCAIRAPTLVVHGDRDPTPVAAARERTAAIPDARLVVLPNVGHFPHVELPDRCFPAVHTFLSGRWPEETRA